MADQKISQLSAATALTGSELVPIVQSSATVATTPAAIKTYTNSAIPNSALANINTSTTDTTNANIIRNGDWGLGTTAFAITDFTSTALNYSQIFRSVSATGGPGVAISGVAAPYDGTPNTNYIGVTGGGTGAARLWAGTKNGATATPTWTEFARLTSPTFTSNLGLGGISTTYLLSIAGSLTGGTTTGGINISSTIQSDVTATAYGILANPTTAATAFTLGTYTGVQVGVSLGAGSTVTNAYGFRATSLLSSNATNAYGFYSEIAAGSGNKFNIYASGTAQNYLGGPVGLGAITQNGWTFRNLLSITGATTAYQNTSGGVVQSDVTSTAVYNEANANTAAASFTLPSLIYYRANQGTFGAGSTVTSQNGFVAAASLIGATTTNIGFRGLIPAATGRWNMYLDGTAQNYILGNVGIGSGKTVPTCALDVNGQVAQSTATGVTAAGTNLATATALTATYNVVSTVSAGQGVSLPNVTGAPIWIFNNQGTNALTVYPSDASSTINGGAAGAGISLAANGKMLYVRVSATAWYTMS